MKPNDALMVGSLEVPSGRVFDQLDLQIAMKMAICGSIFLLDKPKSGVSEAPLWSYVDLRDDLTYSIPLEWLVGRRIGHFFQQLSEEEERFQEAARKDDQLCLIGIPAAGTALASAAALVSYADSIYFGDQIICHRLMRDAEKRGEPGQYLNGPPKHGHFYCMVDNAMTTGHSIRQARNRLAGQYLQVPCVVLVDRQQGGMAKTPDVFSIYNLLDLAYAFWKLGLWNGEQFQKVEKEIQENQF